VVDQRVECEVQKSVFRRDGENLEEEEEGWFIKNSEGS
jgi:hypothetical protein